MTENKTIVLSAPCMPVDIGYYSQHLGVDESGEVFFHIPDKTPSAINKQIDDLTDLIFLLPDDKKQIDFTDDTEHTIINGVYTRKLFIRKGTILIGKYHLKECVNIVAMGDVTVLTETGCNRLGAGFIGVSQTGSRKVGLAHEDTIFFNIFRTDKTNIDEIEDEIYLDHKQKEGVCLEL